MPASLAAVSLFYHLNVLAVIDKAKCFFFDLDLPLISYLGSRSVSTFFVIGFIALRIFHQCRWCEVVLVFIFAVYLPNGHSLCAPSVHFIN